MIEAMACGTPVIAFHCGSVPEVMEDGLTGFVVDDVDERGGGGDQAGPAVPPLDPFPLRGTLQRPRHGAGICEDLPASWRLEETVAVAAE